MNLSKKLIASFFGLSLVFLGIFLSSNRVAAVSVNKFFSPNINCNGESTHTLNKTIYSPGETITVSATGQLSCSNGGSTTQSSYADTVWFDVGSTTSHPLFVNSGMGSTSGSTTFTAVAGGGSIQISYQIADGNTGGSWASDILFYSTSPLNVNVWATDIYANTTDTIKYGQAATIHWTSTGTIACAASKNGFAVSYAPTGTNGYFANSPTVDSVYTVTCSSAGGPGSGSTNLKVVPNVTVTANPKNITSGSEATITWTSNGAGSCNAGTGNGTGTNGSFVNSPSVTTVYPVVCLEAPSVTPGSCSGNFITSSSSCVGTVVGSICSGGGNAFEGEDCDQFNSSSSCPGTTDPWCRHGCHWENSSTSNSCVGLTQAACSSHSTCTWTPGSSIPGDSGSGTDTVTVTEKTVFSGFPLSVPPMQKNIAIPINTSTELAWTASGFSNNYPATAHCAVYNSDDSIANDSAGNPLTQMALIIPSANLEIQSGDNNFKVKCYEDSSQNTTYTDGPNHLVVTGPATYVDLTAGGITPVTATPGTNVNFEAIVTNSGTASTVDSFSNIFQTAIGFDDGYAPLGVKTYSVSGMPAVGPNGVKTFSKVITLTATDIFIRACADKSSATSTGVIVESNENNNCSGWVQLVPLPDLIALAATPSVATAGTPVTLSAMIKNQGTVSTMNSFMNFFQVSTVDPNGGGNTGGGGTTAGPVRKINPISSLFFNIAKAGTCRGQTLFDLPATSMSALIANGTSPTTKSYTFDNDGMYWIRACADKNSSSNTGTIAESNGNNNCGPWTQVAVGLAPIDGDCGCTVTHYNCGSGTSINQTSGQSSWTWTCQGSQNTTPKGLSPSCSEPKPLPMSGTLTAQTPSCTILKGDSTCKINFSWTTLNPVGTSAVAKPNPTPPPIGTVVAVGNGRSNVPFVVKYNSETFYLYNNAQLLDQETVTSVCESGSFWKDGICREVVAYPDLVAGRTSPAFVAKGVITDFSTLVTNQGDGSTVKKFSNFFQLADDIDENFNGINVSDLSPSVITDPLTASTSRTVTLVKYTLDEMGTKYMRACADKSSSSDLGDITESIEGNNCGPWTMITVGESINGECSSSAVFGCTSGNSIDNVAGSAPNNPSTWRCQGINGTTASCFSPYVPTCPAGLIGPPVCNTCENGANNPPNCTDSDLCPNDPGTQTTLPCSDGDLCPNDPGTQTTLPCSNGDLCPNDPGIQTTLPCSDGDLCPNDPGTQTTLPCPGTDLCPKDAGIQTTLPCPNGDLCPNDAGIQTTLPCPGADLCPNDPGIQTTLPCSDGDLCPNNPGIQITLPCPEIDLCPNDPGPQTILPCLNGDYCPKIPGIQKKLPCSKNIIYKER